LKGTEENNTPLQHNIARNRVPSFATDTQRIRIKSAAAKLTRLVHKTKCVFQTVRVP
jgi:hypothetical protein